MSKMRRIYDDIVGYADNVRAFIGKDKKYNAEKFRILRPGERAEVGDECYWIGSNKWHKQTFSYVVGTKDDIVRQRIKSKLKNGFDLATEAGYDPTASCGCQICINYTLMLKNIVFDTSKWSLVQVGKKQQKTDLVLDFDYGTDSCAIIIGKESQTVLVGASVVLRKKK